MRGNKARGKEQGRKGEGGRKGRGREGRTRAEGAGSSEGRRSREKERVGEAGKERAREEQLIHENWTCSCCCHYSITQSPSTFEV